MGTLVSRKHLHKVVVVPDVELEGDFVHEFTRLLGFLAFDYGSFNCD
jgi:hypothetical protein